MAAWISPLGAQDGYERRYEWWSRAPDGCSNYVAEFGNGPPAIVVHGGWGAQHSYMLGAVDSLGKFRRVIMYDQRGSMRSPFKVYGSGGSFACPDSLISVAKHVEDLVRLRSSLNVERVDLLADSMGGFLAMSCLEQIPQHVGRLVLVSTIDLKTPSTPEDSALSRSQLTARDQLFDRPAVANVMAAEGLRGRPVGDRDVFKECRIRFAAAKLFHVERWREARGGMAFQNHHVGQLSGRSMPTTWDFIPLLQAQSSQVTIIHRLSGTAVVNVLPDFTELIPDEGPLLVREARAAARSRRSAPWAAGLPSTSRQMIMRRTARDRAVIQLAVAGWRGEGGSELPQIPEGIPFLRDELGVDRGFLSGGGEHSLASPGSRRPLLGVGTLSLHLSERAD